MSSSVQYVDTKNTVYPLITMEGAEYFGSCCAEGPGYPGFWHGHGPVHFKVNATSPEVVRQFLINQGWSTSWKEESPRHADGFTMNGVFYRL